MHRWLLLFTIILPASVTGAQGERWYKLYDQAKDDLDHQRWESAIRKLEQALAQKADSGASVRGEGTKRVAYFPYFLIGKAYYHLGRYDEAAKFLNREANLKLPERIATEITVYRTYLRAIEEDRKRTAEFNRLVERARTLRARGAFAEAVDVLRGACVLLPAEFERRNLGRTLGELENSEKRRVEGKFRREKETRFLALVSEASEREKQGRLRDAGKLLLEADRLLSGRVEAITLRKRLEGRERRYARLKEAALANQLKGKLPQALQALKEAREADPERFTSDRLGPLAASLSRQIQIENDLRARAKTATATEAKLPGRAPETRIQRRVASNRREAVRDGSLPDADALRRAVLTAYQGAPEEAVQMLDEIKSKSRMRDPEVESSIGIAYARLSFLTANQSDSERFRETATRHFKMALTLDPAHKLNPRLVAPQIMDLFNASR